MAKHTPTPWHISGFEQEAGGASRVIMGSDNFSIAHVMDRTPAENEADAALIVDAVNSYESLKAALVLAEDVLSRYPFSTALWPNGMHPQVGIEQIRNALSRASVKGAPDHG